MKFSTRARITSLPLRNGSRICCIVRLSPMLSMLEMTKTATARFASTCRVWSIVCSSFMNKSLWQKYE